MTRRRAVLPMVRTALSVLLLKVVPDPAPDTATIIDLGATPPKVVAEIPVPGSVVGPPMSVAITPDQGLALITSSMKVDPGDRTKTIPDDRLSVVDLKATPPAVIATREAGKGAAGVSVNRPGTLALVANRAEGTVSVFTIQGKTVAPAGLLRLGNDKSGPSHAVFTPDGKTALVTRDGDGFISILSILAIDGTKVEYTKRDPSPGLRPHGIDISADGSVAVVANIGRGGGDNDTVSVVDLRATPVRVVETVTVGQTPEGIMLSPCYNANGKLLLYRVDGTRLVPLAAAWIGRWSQGSAFSADSRTILGRTWSRRRSRPSGGTAPRGRTPASASRPTEGRPRSAPPAARSGDTGARSRDLGPELVAVGAGVTVGE